METTSTTSPWVLAELPKAPPRKPRQMRTKGAILQTINPVNKFGSALSKRNLVSVPSGGINNDKRKPSVKTAVIKRGGL